MLAFPQGIRLANSEDLLNFADYSEVLNKINMATIEPGYKLFCSDDGIFQNYAEINIDSQHTWNLFCSLCKKLLPTEVLPIVGSAEDDEQDLFKGRYSTTIKLLEQFDRFKFYLVNDCHVQFGFASISSENIFEVFVTPTKHFKVWTNKVNVLEDIMKEYNLVQSHDLQFIDEFPRVTKNLEYSEDLYGYEDLIDFLIEAIA